MGRPLFSASYTTPAVRSEPQPAPPTILFEKWTYWNAFDPDSDEFFDSPDAVYEAFLDPADVQPVLEERADSSAEPERLGELIARELAESRSDSSASSEGTISGRGSPMAVGSDDPASMLVDAYRVDEFEPRRYSQRVTESDFTGRTRHQSDHAEHQRTREARHIPPYRYADDDVLTTTALDLMNERRVSRVMPPLSPFRSRGFIPNFPSTRSITPPQPHDRDQDDSYPYITHERTNPSPPPSVTPRLYSWSARNPLGRADPGSPSPLPLQRQRLRPGPLTNPNARMSLAHLSPAPVRVRMA